MQIVEPRVIVPYIDGVQLMKNIELAGRTCYKSESKSEDSYKQFIRSCIARGHESVIEHEKVSVRLITDRGTMWDITRHRHASFSIESTRYCNYTKDKFGNEIKVIEPFFLKPDVQDEGLDKWQPYLLWVDAIHQSEQSYFQILNGGAKPDYARMVLPASLATEICMTANMREWRHIFKLRCQNTVHPHVRQVMIPLLLHFKEVMPELFDDIEYDEEFVKQYKNFIPKVELEATPLQLWSISKLYELSCEPKDDEGMTYNNGYIDGQKAIVEKVLNKLFVDKAKEKLNSISDEELAKIIEDNGLKVEEIKI